MSRVQPRFILDRIFRASPEFTLRSFAELSEKHQELLEELRQDPESYGILVPTHFGATSIKSVSRDTAWLLQSLREAGPLPASLTSAAGESACVAIAELVLDGVLQVQDRHRFVSGADAFALLYDSEPLAEPQGFLAKLSRAALEYGQALAMNDAVSLSLRLYGYNQLPLTQTWQRRFPDQKHVAEVLGLVGSSWSGRLEEQWSLMEDNNLEDAWWHFRPRRAATANEGHGLCPYKLYVSPHPEALPEVFRAVVERCSEDGAPPFKVGRTIQHLLRPDKFVLYFHCFEELHRAAKRLSVVLQGCPAHGVPFTAALTEDGLLSWGVDPQAGAAVRLRGPESWRLWITNHLASALIAARDEESSAMQPWQFALERLALRHVDIDTWAPQPAYLSMAA